MSEVGMSLRARERAAIRAACLDRLSWTDGGHWIGTGPAPACGRTLRQTAQHTLDVAFLTNASADRWNAECERNIRYFGHGGTVLLGLAGYLTGGTLGAASALVGVSIAKDELQAKVPYPRANRGSRLTLRIDLELLAPLHSHQSERLQVRRRLRMVDYTGLVTYELDRRDTIRLEPDLVDTLASGRLMQDSANRLEM